MRVHIKICIKNYHYSPFIRWFFSHSNSICLPIEGAPALGNKLEFPGEPFLWSRQMDSGFHCVCLCVCDVYKNFDCNFGTNYPIPLQINPVRLLPNKSIALFRVRAFLVLGKKKKKKKNLPGCIMQWLEALCCRGVVSVVLFLWWRMFSDCKHKLLGGIEETLKIRII